MYNIPDVGPGKKEYATKRCLDKVFEHIRCKEFGFNYSNTIIIDSDSDKIMDHLKNSILMKPYEASDVLKPTED
jgi:hypothetical protein